MADLADLIRQLSFYQSGGRPEGQRDIDKINALFGNIKGIADSHRSIIADSLAAKKAQLENQKIEREGTPLTDRFQKVQGSQIAGTASPQGIITSPTQVSGMPEYLKSLGEGDFTLGETEKLAGIRKDLIPKEKEPMKQGVHYFVDKKSSKLLGQIPSSPGTGDTVTLIGGETSQDNTSIASQLRKEFINRPEVQDYQLVRTNINAMDSLYKGLKGGNTGNRVALDQGLITMYNKLTDPNSVVRESEYARTPENLPFINRLSGAIDKVKAGGAGLTDSDREALVIGAKIIGNERGKVFNELRGEYNKLSNLYKIDNRLTTGTLPEFKPYEYQDKYDKDVIDYAEKWGISPEEAQQIKNQRQGK